MDGVGKLLAAVDLGSNSFHMVLAQEEALGLRLLDRLREGVRLAEGLGEGGRLDPAVQDRALACLARFGQRLRGLPPERVRVLGTNTLRTASAATDFLDAAERVLGYPVEIVSGREEARLAYLGVAHSLGMESDERRLVIDIGGGSTEIIVGQGFAPLVMESLGFGCVITTRRHFPEGRIDEKVLGGVERQLKVSFEPMQGEFLASGWNGAVGCSGTIKAIGRILEQNGFGPRITTTGMTWLRQQLLSLGDIRRLGKIKGLKEDRIPVFAGGFAILNALMQALGIQSLRVSDGALREGAIYDLLGRIHQEDTRDNSIAALQTRFHVNRKRNEAITGTAEVFYRGAATPWSLLDRHRVWLRWAVAVHDIGLDIAHSGFHRHGDYILRNADLSGFSRREQGLLAAMVRAQRKALPKLEDFLAMGVWRDDVLAVQRLAVLLRLAILFHRGMLPPPFIPDLRIEGAQTLRLVLPDHWEEAMPLLAADLEREQGLLAPHFILRW